MPFASKTIISKIQPVDAAGVLVAVALTVMFAFGLLAPISARDRAAAARMQDAALQQQRANATAAEIQTLGREIDTSRQTITTARFRARPQSSLNECLADIMGLAADCKLVASDVKPGVAMQTSHFVMTSIQLAGTGSSTRCAEFLHAINERSPDMAIRSFKLTARPDMPPGICDVQVEINWLAAPDKMATPVQTAATPMQ